MRTIVMLLVGTMLTPLPLAAQQPAEPPVPQNEPQRRDLEEWARQLAQSMSQRLAFVQRPSVNCGLTLVAPDPRLDAKARVPPPQSGAAPTIRTIRPTVCAPDQSGRPLFRK